MKNLFVPYELAVKFKEKGFDEKCLSFYDVGGLYPNEIELVPLNIKGCSNSDGWLKKQIENCSAPLWQQVIDWLREEKNISIEATPYYGPDGSWHGYSYGGFFVKSGEWKITTPGFCDTYYIALQSGIEKALELI